MELLVETGASRLRVVRFGGQSGRDVVFPWSGIMNNTLRGGIIPCRWDTYLEASASRQYGELSWGIILSMDYY